MCILPASAKDLTSLIWAIFVGNSTLGDRCAFNLLFSIDTRVIMRCLEVYTYINVHDTKKKQTNALVTKVSHKLHAFHFEKNS